MEKEAAAASDSTAAKTPDRSKPSVPSDTKPSPAGVDAKAADGGGGGDMNDKSSTRSKATANGGQPSRDLSAEVCNQVHGPKCMLAYSWAKIDPHVENKICSAEIQLRTGSNNQGEQDPDESCLYLQHRCTSEGLSCMQARGSSLQLTKLELQSSCRCLRMLC